MTTNIDLEAAQAFQLSINCSLFADDVTDLTERFAAHRRRERERIVGIVEDVLGPTAFAAVLAAIHQLESEA